MSHSQPTLDDLAIGYNQNALSTVSDNFLTAAESDSLQVLGASTSIRILENAAAALQRARPQNRKWAQVDGGQRAEVTNGKIWSHSAARLGDTRHSCLIARTEHCARKPVPSLTRLRPGNLRSIPGREFEAPNRGSPPPVIQSIFESNSIFLNLRAGYLVVGSPANLRRFSTTRQRYELASGGAPRDRCQ